MGRRMRDREEDEGGAAAEGQGCCGTAMLSAPRAQDTHIHPPNPSTALVPGQQLPPPAKQGQGLSKSMPHTVFLEGRFLLSCRS